MLTLHVEAETIHELQLKAAAALDLFVPPEVHTITATVPPVAGPKAPRKPKAPVPTPAPTPNAPPEPAPAVVEGDKLRRQFEALVEKDYDSALSILDALGVANYAAVIDGNMGDQLALAMEAFT